MQNIQRLDLIGDIHGHADKLKSLLVGLGYQNIENAYQHPEKREVVFVGDFIDRGKQNREVINLVKAMIDSGSAQAVMGNHEYNAICYHTKDSEGNYLRKHNVKHTKQHQSFLDEFKEGSDDLIEVLDWFKTLPLFLEFEGARVIHACWDQSMINQIKKVLTDKVCHKNEAKKKKKSLTQHLAHSRNLTCIK